MPKVTHKTGSMGEIDIDTGGVVNPKEAEDHANELELIMANIEEWVEPGDTRGLLDKTLRDIKARLATTTLAMETANINTVTQSIRDNDFKVLTPRSDEVEKLLEEILPSDEIPGAPGVIQSVQEEDMLKETNQGLIRELFDTLEMAHNQLATACVLLGRLSCTLKPSQLMLVIKASIRPLIQLNAATGLNIATTSNRTPELPDDQAERIKLMIVLDHEASQLKKEKINSPMRLLAATYAFKTINRLGDGTTQRRMQK